MASILDQNFDDDEEDEEEFNPAPAGDSDAEDAGSDEEKPARANDRSDAGREKSRTPGTSRRDGNEDDPPQSARPNGRPPRDEEEDDGEDDEGEGEDLNGDDDEEDEEDDEDEDIASVSPTTTGYADTSYKGMLTPCSHGPEKEGGEASTSSSRKKPKLTRTTTMSKMTVKTL